MMTEHPYKLRSLDIGDFKSIKHANITLHPLSIVVGANSSGKSSLLQVVLAISQAVRSRSAGTAFPLNGEYARFGSFTETVRFLSQRQYGSEDSERQIELRATISESMEPDLIRSWAQNAEGADLDRVDLDWALKLSPDSDTDDDSAKISSVRLRMCRESNSDDPDVFMRYDLGSLKDMESERQASRHRILDPTGRRPDSRNVLTETKGSYHEKFEEDSEVRLKCDAVELRGAVPESVYALSVLSDAVGQQWWNAARRFASLADTTTTAVPSDAPGPTTEEDKTLCLQAMVESAGRAAREIRDTWQERSDSRRWNPPIAVQLHYMLHEQFDKAEDNGDRGRIEKGLELLSVQSFLEELSRHLAGEEWAQEQVWSSPDDSFGPNISWASYVIHHFFGREVKYLGPLRKAPQVLYDPRLRDLDLGLSGEYTAAILHANSEHQVVPISEQESDRVSLQSEVNLWLNRFGLASEARLADRGRLGIGLKITLISSEQTVDLTSVGVGVSQILPVIVLCLLTDPGELVILEQPELHLHPALQQQLGDFLLDCANSGRQVLVETHSEHLVNRVRRRVADLSGADEGMVGLLFAEQRDGVTDFRQSVINPYGGTEAEWPEGFFDVSAREAQALVATSLTKRHREMSDQLE